jgi:hypothetical protein
LAKRPPKKNSTIVRVKNTAEFLERYIDFVVDLVDELNGENFSVDVIADVIADLCSRFPKKFKPFEYPYKIARYGEETLMLAATKEGKKSPPILLTTPIGARLNAPGPTCARRTAIWLQRIRSQTTIERFRDSEARILCQRHKSASGPPDA